MINKNKQFIIITVGHIWSGKTTLAKRLEQHFNINRINNDSIREYIIENIKYYNNINYSYKTDISTKMNKSVKTIKNTILKDLISFWESVILDAGHIRQNTRIEAFKNTKHVDKNKKIETIIINCNIDDEELIKRLEDRDIKSWHKTKRKQYYIETKKYQFQEVQWNEANHILNYNQKNIDEILKKLKLILK